MLYLISFIINKLIIFIINHQTFFIIIIFTSNLDFNHYIIFIMLDLLKSNLSLIPQTIKILDPMKFFLIHQLSML